MRLAIYAHYGSSPQVAGHVWYYLEQIIALGFQLCFVSNSEISPASEAALKKICERVIVRENTGLDFSMWQRGLAEYDLSKFEELLLTNSSIIGPLAPLAPLWQNPALADCDFWGLTDSTEISYHLQSYFLVFRQSVIRSPCFVEFWRAVLPYREKLQIIRSYEAGLTCWFEEAGFKWKAIFPQAEIWPQFKQGRGFVRGTLDFLLQRNQTPLNTTLFAPDVLLQHGMPFVKASLLNNIFSPSNARKAFAWLKDNPPPAAIASALTNPPAHQSLWKGIK